ncbi:DNA-binding protein [Clostridia bacterium]|nr:DNA-binding protein [Clostridia bacterium]GHV32654.1 DNA-binding protein [Clostridia bacterium]
MDYISTKEAAERWGISERRIQKLCEGNRIPGAIRFSRVWAIPRNAEKPIDGRLRSEREKRP